MHQINHDEHYHSMTSIGNQPHNCDKNNDCRGHNRTYVNVSRPMNH